jgi:hypothetical protein
MKNPGIIVGKSQKLRNKSKERNQKRKINKEVEVLVPHLPQMRWDRGGK